MWEMIFNYTFLLSIFFHLLYTNILFKLCLILPMGILMYGLYNKKDSQDNGLYKYKIHSNIINIFLITVYLFFHIYLLLYIRTKYLNTDLDLKKIFYSVKLFFIGTSLLDMILFLILLVITLLCIIKIHQFFIIQFIKRHLLLYKDRTKLEKLITPRTFINLHGWSFLLTNLACNLSLKVNLNMRVYHFIVGLINYLLFSFPLHFIISFFIYLIFLNSFILSPTFNNLLYLFILYSFYKRISNYYHFTESYLNEMVYNMYYRTDTILYVNMPKDWEDVVYKYVNNGLQRNKEKDPVPSLDYNLGEFEITIDTKHTYRSTDGITYTNSQGDYFIEEHVI